MQQSIVKFYYFVVHVSGITMAIIRSPSNLPLQPLVSVWKC